MYAQLGEIIFENLKGFTEFRKSGGAQYAQHALLDGKPHLQRTGSALNTIDIAVRFHAVFCNPTDQNNIIKNYRDSGEILPLLYGNGRFEGDFVITESDETIENADGDGNIISMLVNMKLLEYITPDKLQAQKETNVKKAKATGDKKKPVTKKKVTPPTCPQEISKIVTSVENHAFVINNFFTSKGGPQTAEQKASVRQHLVAINRLCAELEQRDANSQSCILTYPAIASKGTEIKTDTVAYQNMVGPIVPMTQIANKNFNFQKLIRQLKTNARPLINQTITRK